MTYEGGGLKFPHVYCLYSNCMAKFYNICQVDWPQPGVTTTPVWVGWC